jgi:hypothetical protein
MIVSTLLLRFYFIHSMKVGGRRTSGSRTLWKYSFFSPLLSSIISFNITRNQKRENTKKPNKDKRECMIIICMHMCDRRVEMETGRIMCEITLLVACYLRGGHIRCKSKHNGKKIVNKYAKTNQKGSCSFCDRRIGKGVTFEFRLSLGFEAIQIMRRCTVK